MDPGHEKAVVGARPPGVAAPGRAVERAQPDEAARLEVGDGRMLLLRGHHGVQRRCHSEALSGPVSRRGKVAACGTRKGVLWLVRLVAPASGRSEFELRLPMSSLLPAG